MRAFRWVALLAIAVGGPAAADPVVLHGRFVAHDGTPVSHVSQLRLIPADPAGFPVPKSPPDARAEPAWETPATLSDGSFTAAVPCPGRYRLLVDLYERSTPSPSQLVVALKPGANRVTVTLPKPLARVPAGARVSWLTWNAPAEARRLVAAGRDGLTPVYGPRDQLLAYWCQQDARALVLYAPAPGGTHRRQVLPGNPAILAPRDAGNPPRRDGVQLHFPPADYSKPQQVLEMPITAQYDVPSRAEWVSPPGSRLEVDRSMPAGATRISLYWLGAGFIRDVPISHEKGADTPVVCLPPWELGAVVSGRILCSDGHPYAGRPVTAFQDGAGPLRLMADEEGRFRIGGVRAGDLTVALDLYRMNLAVEDRKRPPPVAAPAPLPVAPPPTQGGPAPINPVGVLREWMPPPEFEVLAGWTLSVPDEGLADVLLQAAPEPALLGLSPSSFPKTITPLWWLPDRGKPARLYVQGSYDMAAGPGCLWFTGAHEGKARAFRLVVRPGRLSVGSLAPAGGPLGLRFPHRTDQDPPGPVTLVGEGPLVGIRVAYPRFRWQWSEALRLMVGQISAVPPGRYRVTVQTPGGLVSTPVTITDYGASLKLAYPGRGRPAPAVR